jgi:hypothetical protein
MRRTGWMLLPAIACALAYAEDVPELTHNPFDRPELKIEPSAAADTKAGGWPEALRATLIDGPYALANLDGRFVAVGEDLDGAVVVRIGEGSVTLERDGEQRTMTLHPQKAEQDNE